MHFVLLRLSGIGQECQAKIINQEGTYRLNNKHKQTNISQSHNEAITI